MGMRLIGPVFMVGGQDFNMVYLDWPANDCNSYLVDTGDQLVMVDCGCGESASAILRNIKDMEFNLADLSHVLLTHAHFPHAGGAEALRKNGVEVVAAPAAVKPLTQGGPATAAYHYAHRFPRVEGEVTAMEDSEEMELGRCRITALHLPGHSPGSVGWEVACEGRRLLFCGDVVRSPALPQQRARLGYDHDAYVQSLLRLLEDPPHVLYPGHGPFCLSHTDQWIGQELRKLLKSGHAES